MATDKLVDFDHVTDYISREAAYKTLTEYYHHSSGVQHTVLREALNRVPTADVVARDCYDRILAENDTMREMLARIGKKCGDSMDDVRPVVRAHWIYHEDDCGDYYECSHCHDEYVVYEDDMCWKHCPTCGAYMWPDKNGQIGEKDNG